jgi:hypothetical protein
MMKPTKQDAETMLTGAGRIESAVRARAPREYPLYLWAGLTPVLAGLVLDLNRGDDSDSVLATVVGIVGLVIVAAFVAVHVLYWRRYRQVRRRRTSVRLEWALAAWSAAALFGLGFLLADTLGFAFTLGGIVGAVPTLLWAERLRRTA